MPITKSKFDWWRRQTKILPLIDHPYIVKILGHTTDHYQIIFEMYNGITLYDHLNYVRALPSIGNHSLLRVVPEELARDILKNLVLTVRELHMKRFAHLKISVSNVMIMKQPNESLSIKLIDFGYSSPLSDYLKAWDILKDPIYHDWTRFLPPDFHNQLKVSFDSYDVYLMGILLFSLVTGFPPYEIFDITGETFIAKPNDRSRESLYTMLYKEDFDGFWRKIGETYLGLY